MRSSQNNPIKVRHLPVGERRAGDRPARPRIDHAALPDLDILTGVFASRADAAGSIVEGDNEAHLLPALFPFMISG